MLTTVVNHIVQIVECLNKIMNLVEIFAVGMVLLFLVAGVALKYGWGV